MLVECNNNLYETKPFAKTIIVQDVSDSFNNNHSNHNQIEKVSKDKQSLDSKGQEVKFHDIKSSSGETDQTAINIKAPFANIIEDKKDLRWSLSKFRPSESSDEDNK